MEVLKEKENKQKLSSLLSNKNKDRKMERLSSSLSGSLFLTLQVKETLRLERKKEKQTKKGNTQRVDALEGGWGRLALALSGRCKLLL